MNPIRFYTIIYWRKFKKSAINFLKGKDLLEAEREYEKAVDNVRWAEWKVIENRTNIMRLKGVIALLKREGYNYYTDNSYCPMTKEQVLRHL